MKNITGILTLLMLTSNTYAADDYVVRTKIFDGENLVAAPAMQIAAKQETTATVSGSYDSKLSIEPAGDSTAHIHTNLTNGSEHLAPSMLVEYDQERTITIKGQSISILVSKLRS